MYTPRLPYEIFAGLVSRVVSTSKVLTDLAEGSVLGSILGSVAEEMSGMERRLKELWDSFYLGGAGTNLDRRLRDFPPGFPARRGATPAVGGAFRITRSVTTGTTTVAAGGMVVSASVKPGVTYTNLVPIIIGPGDTQALDIPFMAMSPGSVGNLPHPGIIDTIQRGLPEIVECTNMQPLAGGADRERDEDLRRRAERWVGALALSQNEAIEAVALNFQASNGVVLQHARIWNDPDMRGYSELVVDDGTGMQGYTRVATTQTGVLPTLIGPGARYQLPFEFPAATVPVVRTGGVERPQTSYNAFHEFGYVMLNRSLPYTVTPGDSWEVGGHLVYTGIIAELQAYINTICAAAGVRVRVVAPVPQPVQLSLNMTVAGGTDIRALRATVRRAIVGFVARLAPGQPLIMYRLIGALNTIPGVVNIVFDQTDLYPGSPKHKLVATLQGVSVR